MKAKSKTTAKEKPSKKICHIAGS